MHKIAQDCGIISKNKSDSLQIFKRTWGIINGFRVGLNIGIINNETINLSTRKYYLAIHMQQFLIFTYLTNLRGMVSEL
jgi:hypothetical protein